MSSVLRVFLVTGVLVFTSLLGLAQPQWSAVPGGRMARVEASGKPEGGFSEISPFESNVIFTNRLSDSLLMSDSSLLSGSGVALGDVDGDGLCDIYLCSLAGRNALFKNLGNWHFKDITDESHVSCEGQISRGAVLADVDGDGDLDLLVTGRGTGVRLFLNDGKGVFSERTAESGLASSSGSTSMALADIDGDGDLDLYLANFGVGSVLRDGGQITTRIVNGRTVVVGRHAKRVKVINGQFVEFGEADVLYLNNGMGHFTPVPWDQGAFLENGKPVETPMDFGLAVQMRDLNEDGLPDIYVCNDFFTPDRIWINRGGGRFEAIAPTAVRKISNASMGVDFADIDRDGHMDGLVVEMLARDLSLRLRQMTPDMPSGLLPPDPNSRPQTGRNTLLYNRGDGTFADIAEFAGLAASDWSWMPAFIDVDLDGFEDVLIPNGHAYDLLDLDEIERSKAGDPRASGKGTLRFPKISSPNCAFRNLGNRRFTECAKAWGFDSKNVCNGMAMADLDGDGDLDLVVNALNTNAMLYRNESSGSRLAIRLKGQAPNTRGTGSLITVRGGPVPSQSQEMISGGRYESSDDAVRVFAASTNGLSVEVRWRSGRVTLLKNAVPNRLYELDESVAETSAPVKSSRTKPLFTDVSDRLSFVSTPEAFDDLERQPLLPRRMSRRGPALAWFDLDHDSRDELIVGGTGGSAPAVFRFNADGSATRVAIAGSAAAAGAAFAAGGQDLLCGLFGYEKPSDSANRLYWLALNPNPQFKADNSLMLNAGNAVGAVATADVDGDGQLEVFIGGACKPGRYPEPADSALFRKTANTWVEDSKALSAFKSVGLVNAATFSDLDGDGKPELILACEWGPLRVFRFTEDGPKEITSDLGFDKFTGLWQSVATGDFDGDGRMDILAGNWGLNDRRHATATHPLTLLYGDFNRDGSVQLLETVYDAASDRLRPFRDRRTTVGAMPFIQERFPTHRAFSEATVQELLGDRISAAKTLTASTLESVLFLNRGNRFEAVPLPDEAQWTPVFGISIGDFDGGGCEDALLAQNFFDTPSEASRLDAGRGLLLKGDGRGGLSAVPGQLSGIIVYGEQRGCAAGDYNGDGRLDWAVAQHGEAVRLFRNEQASPGLRIRLKGPDGKPGGIGAMVRLGTAKGLGPAREVHGGGGLWSQDSTVQVMSPARASKVSVRWPGQAPREMTLPEGSAEVEIDISGTARKIR